jgi:hypothetical protein
MTLAGSASSPILDPAFEIRGWGESIPRVEIDGKTVQRGKDLRIGRRYRLEGTDLILWLKLEKESPAKITIKNE